MFLVLYTHWPGLLLVQKLFGGFREPGCAALAGCAARGQEAELALAEPEARELLPGASKAEASLSVLHHPVSNTRCIFWEFTGSWELYQNGDLIPEVMLSEGVLSGP